MNRKTRKERKREIASLPFKQRIQKIKGWLIAMIVFFAIGILMCVFMPMLNEYLVNQIPTPAEEETTINETCINENAKLYKATLVEQLDATTYVFLVDNEEITMSLAGIDLTDGFTFDKKYDAHDFLLKDFIVDEIVYIEYEPNNLNTGYVWFADVKATENDVQEYMYNAMLIYGNFANRNDADSKYSDVLQKIEDDRPKLSKVENWFVEKILSLIVK